LVIRLNVFDGMSHSSISNLTGLKLGTVKTHIRRGLTKVREAMFYQTLPSDGDNSDSQYYDVVEDGSSTGVGSWR